MIKILILCVPVALEHSILGLFNTFPWLRAQRPFWDRSIVYYIETSLIHGVYIIRIYILEKFGNFDIHLVS